MSPRHALLGLAALFLLGGIVVGFAPVHAQGISCGSVFAASNNAEFEDDVDQIGGTLSGATPDDDPTNYQSACDDGRGDRRLPTYGLIGLAAIALIAAFVASPTSPARTVADDPDFRKL